MRKKMFAALGIILMLFAFVACQGEPTTISEEQAKANELAADYISSIRYAEVLNVAFKNNPDLKVEDADATSVTVTFNNYTGDAVPATGDIKGIESGSLKYTFTTTATKAVTKSYTIETAKPLAFSLKDGSTAEDTIEFKISGSCKVDLTITDSKITGVKDATFGEIEKAEGIIVGDMPVNIEDIEITIDNSTPSTDEPSEPTEKIYKLAKDTKVSEIRDVFKSYDGIKGNGTEAGSYVLTVDSRINLTKDFTFESVILDGNRERTDKEGEPNTTVGISIEAGSSDIVISVKDSIVRDFGIAFLSDNINEDDTLSNGLLTMEITGSSFTNCYKGLYVTNLKDLSVTDSEFTNMGTDSSVPTDPNNPSTPDLMNRSGSAFDINQMLPGNSIVIEGSSFSLCGAAEDTQEKTTSGAIKVKVRGGDNEKGPDIPQDANGQFTNGVTIENCTFNGNRKDIVIGTDKSVDSADFDFTYTAGTENPRIEDNAENTLVIVKNTNYSDIEISNYAGIRGAASERVVVTMGSNTITPKANSTRFVLRSVVLQGSEQGMPEANDTPIGINLNNIAGDITLSIVDSEIKDFGTAIMSNKVTGDSGNKSNKAGKLTLIIEDSKFSNCYKGLYVTNLNDLTVTGSIFNEIGKASTPPESGEPTIPEKMKRSGAAFDINQTTQGGSIVIKDSTFTNCGGERVIGSKLTSGAIKVKLRGNEGDTSSDVPQNANSSFEGFMVDEACIFRNNRADIVIGTSNVPSTAMDEELMNIADTDAEGHEIFIEDKSLPSSDTSEQ